MLPEPDEEVARESDALPADVQQEVVVRQDKEEHRRNEEVEVPKEFAPIGVVLHVAEGIDVDEGSDDSDEENEHHRQLIELEGHIGLELPGEHPREQALADRALLRAAVHETNNHEDAENRRRRYSEDCEVRTPGVRASPAEQEHSRAEQWERDEQPDQREDALGGHDLLKRGCAFRPDDSAGVDHRASSFVTFMSYRLSNDPDAPGRSCVPVLKLLVLEQVRLVDRSGSSSSEDGDNNCESNDNLGCCYDHDKECDDLAVKVAIHPRECNEGKVRGIEHELHAHEDDDRVATHEHTDRPDGEKNR